MNHYLLVCVHILSFICIFARRIFMFSLLLMSSWSVKSQKLDLNFMNIWIFNLGKVAKTLFCWELLRDKKKKRKRCCCVNYWNVSEIRTSVAFRRDLLAWNGIKKNYVCVFSYTKSPKINNCYIFSVEFTVYLHKEPVHLQGGSHNCT